MMTTYPAPVPAKRLSETKPLKDALVLIEKCSVDFGIRFANLAVLKAQLGRNQKSTHETLVWIRLWQTVFLLELNGKGHHQILSQRRIAVRFIDVFLKKIY